MYLYVWCRTRPYKLSDSISAALQGETRDMSTYTRLKNVPSSSAPYVLPTVRPSKFSVVDMPAKSLADCAV